MVFTDIDDDNRMGIIVLRPNHSWSWRANLLFLCIFLCVSLTIGFSFLLAGAWLVLPFSLLEFIVLAGSIYYCVRQCTRQEVITVSEHQVRIEQGMRRPSHQQTFQRVWSNFFVRTPSHPWDPVSLSIRSHGKELEIGSFLNRGDKHKLVCLLRRIIPLSQPASVLPGQQMQSSVHPR